MPKHRHSTPGKVLRNHTKLHKNGLTVKQAVKVGTKERLAHIKGMMLNEGRCVIGYK